MKSKDSGSLNLVLLSLDIHSVNDVSNVFRLVKQIEHRIRQLKIRIGFDLSITEQYIGMFHPDVQVIVARLLISF